MIAHRSSSARRVTLLAAAFSMTLILMTPLLRTGKAWTGVESAAPVERIDVTAQRAGKVGGEARGVDAPANQLARARVAAAYGELPLRFESNRGQTDGSVKFISRGAGYTFFLTPTGAVLRLRDGREARGAGERETGDERFATARQRRSSARESVLRLNLVGANSAPRVEGEDELGGKSNYFIGNDSSRWRANVPNFGRVKYEGVYPGIDLVYYGNQRQLEYDFLVAPGADARRIRLSYEGAQSATIDARGDLVLRTESGDVRQHKPIAYQEISGARREVGARYVLDGKRQVAFELGAYDMSKPLVIDPVLVYSTYVGGSGVDQGLGVAVDAAGNAYVTGTTASSNFPTANPVQGAKGDADLSDAFVLKLNPSGSALVYATYLGGNNEETANSIAVDAAGNAYVAGATSSDNFPRTTGALQTMKSGFTDAFVTKLNASGSALVYSTLLGGNNEEQITGIDVDANGVAYLGGMTNSTQFDAFSVTGARSGDPILKSMNGAASWSESDAGVTSDNVRVFAADPVNAGTIYAGTNHGIFKSVNNGANWSATGVGGDPLLVRNQTYAVVVDPSNPNIVYGGAARGIIKSTNGGMTYELKNNGFDDTGYALAINPVTPTTLYAAGFGFFYKTTNGGDSWTIINFGPNFSGSIRVTQIVINPLSPSTVYVGTDRGVLKSTDGGANWAFASAGLPTSSSQARISSLIIDQSNPSTLYASVGLFINVGVAVYKTTDGGANWTLSNNGLTYETSPGQFGAAISSLGIDPASPSTLYAGTVGGGVFKSVNGGASWSAASAGMTNRRVSTVYVDRSSATGVYAGTNIGDDAFVARLSASGAALQFFMYLGGFEDDEAYGVAAGLDGTAYVTGMTTSSNFPVVGAFQTTYGSFLDAFVSKVNPSGTALAYSTYLGGSNNDGGRSIAVNNGGNAYITGTTISTNFPVANALKSGLTGLSDAFVTKLGANGATLEYSTYLGGASSEEGFGIALDGAGNAYVTGRTTSTDFPAVGPVQPVYGGGTGDAFVTKLNAAGAAYLFSTFLGGASTDQGNAIAVDAGGNAYVAGTTLSTNFPTANALDASFNGTQDAFVAKLTGEATPTTVQFTSANVAVSEKAGSLTVNITRAGDTAGTSTVNYATVNVTASDRSDYTATLGALRFAPNETTKSVNIFITDDTLNEGAETFNLTLGSPSGATLGTPSTLSVTINNDDTANGPNPVKPESFDSQFYVRQHYIDFLNREPDAAGLQFWVNGIESCGANAQCREVKRVDTSAAFFLSIEFQETGYLVYRIYKAAHGNLPGAPVPLTLREFLPDTQQISRGVQVGIGDWQQQLEANKNAFLADFTARARFTDAYPATMTAADFVNALNNNAGGALSTTERDQLINDVATGAKTRAQALRLVAEDADLARAEFNRAFVLMQYFGYLRRNPNETPDADFGGFNFWLGKLNQFNGDYVQAEMVRAFIQSTEYQQRFGQ